MSCNLFTYFMTEYPNKMYNYIIYYKGTYLLQCFMYYNVVEYFINYFNGQAS